MLLILRRRARLRQLLPETHRSSSTSPGNAVTSEVSTSLHFSDFSAVFEGLLRQAQYRIRRQQPQTGNLPVALGV
jgi:hypothetical protein